MDRSKEHFWRATWMAWRLGVLARWLPSTCTLGGTTFESFLKSALVTSTASQPIFMAFTPSEGEFLVWCSERGTFFLTSQRLILRNRDDEMPYAMPLRDIAGYASSAGWSNRSVRVHPRAGKAVRFGVDACLRDEIVLAMIDRARSPDAWSDVRAALANAAAAEAWPKVPQ